MSDDNEVYQPKDAIRESLRSGAYGSALGFGIAAVQNTMKKRNVGALGVFTRSGGTIAMCGLYRQS